MCLLFSYLRDIPLWPFFLCGNYPQSFLSQSSFFRKYRLYAPSFLYPITPTPLALLPSVPLELFSPKSPTTLVAKPNRQWITFYLTFPNGNSLLLCLLWHNLLSTFYFPLYSFFLWLWPKCFLDGRSQLSSSLTPSKLTGWSLSHTWLPYHWHPSEFRICSHSQN